MYNTLKNISFIFSLPAAALLTGCLENPFTSTGGGGGGQSTAQATEQPVPKPEPVVTKSEPPPAPPASVVDLDPRVATRTGEAIYHCWDDGCWWVVWCGHAICDGSWSWSFKSTGTYRITWLNVNSKCAGAPPYEVRINGKTVHSGRVPQYGACHDCAQRRGYGVWGDIDLGNFELKNGDVVTLWAQNEFACGIDGPGAYAAYDALRATLQ